MHLSLNIGIKLTFSSNVHMSNAIALLLRCSPLYAFFHMSNDAARAALIKSYTLYLRTALSIDFHTFHSQQWTRLSLYSLTAIGFSYVQRMNIHYDVATYDFCFVSKPAYEIIANNYDIIRELECNNESITYNNSPPMNTQSYLDLLLRSLASWSS